MSTTMYVPLSSLTDADLLLSPPTTPITTTATTSGTSTTKLSLSTTSIPNLDNNDTSAPFRYNLDPYMPTSTIPSSAYESLSKPTLVSRPSISLPLSSSSSASSTNEGCSGLVPLPYDFVPGIHDVICGRGKAVSEHEGNIRFRTVIETRLEEYKNAICKLDKSLIVSSIVDTITNERPNGGFIKQVNGRWYQVDNHFAREKCGQSFRDLLHNTYKSSTKAKAGRRKQGSKVSKNEDSTMSPAHRKDSLTYGTPITSYSTNTNIVGTAKSTTGSSISMLILEPLAAMNVMPAVTLMSGATANAPKKKEPSIDEIFLESKRRSFEQTVHKLMKGAFVPTPSRPTLSVARASRSSANSETLCGTSCRCEEGA